MNKTEKRKAVRARRSAIYQNDRNGYILVPKEFIYDNPKGGNKNKNVLEYAATELLGYGGVITETPDPIGNKTCKRRDRGDYLGVPFLGTATGDPFYASTSAFRRKDEVVDCVLPSGRLNEEPVHINFDRKVMDYDGLKTKESYMNYTSDFSELEIHEQGELTADSLLFNVVFKRD